MSNYLVLGTEVLQEVVNSVLLGLLRSDNIRRVRGVQSGAQSSDGVTLSLVGDLVGDEGVPLLVSLLDDLERESAVLQLTVVSELVGGLAVGDLVVTQEGENLVGLA